MTTPRISVIVPVYNDTERLKLCLQALEAQQIDATYEVLVIDNGSEEPPREVVESYPRAGYAEEHSKPGSYAARNRGLQLVAGDVIAFTDADCLPEPDWLAEGLRALESLGCDGVVGGRVEIFPADASRPTAAELYDVVFGLNQESNVKNHHGAATANAFTYRRLFDEVGFFNSEIKGGGDLLWGQMVHKAGKPVAWSERAVVRHPARRRMSELLVQHRRHAGGRVDRRRAKGRRLLGARDAWIVLRLIAPPFDLYPRISKRLSELGYGRFRALLVLAVAWRLRLLALWTGAASILGRKTERR